jgi:hypothetical protein
MSHHRQYPIEFISCKCCLHTREEQIPPPNGKMFIRGLNRNYEGGGDKHDAQLSKKQQNNAAVYKTLTKGLVGPD